MNWGRKRKSAHKTLDQLVDDVIAEIKEPDQELPIKDVYGITGDIELTGKASRFLKTTIQGE